MEWLPPGLMAFVLFGLLGSLACASIPDAGSGRHKEAPGDFPSPPDGWPHVSVIVPVTGGTEGMDVSLSSVLMQDYPSGEVIFVTRRHDEEAVALIHGLIGERESRGFLACRHVVSGSATTCGQKNHNLLAGIATVSEKQGVLVFFDASHIAPPHWLRCLVGPIARNEAAVTTGYHHVLPGDRKVATLGRAVTVMILHRLQEIRFLTQPWGGNTAIKRSVFEEMKVGELWATNVVDDVSLAARLKGAGIKVQPVPAADILTPLAGESLGGWSDWLTRQLLYLKFCFPGSWVLAGILLILLAGLLSAASACCVAILIGFGSLDSALPSVCFMLLLLMFGEALRIGHPDPGPRLSWLAGLYLAAFMGCLCHIRCWFAREIHWRRISYRVSRGGSVESITRTDGSGLNF